MTKDLEMTDVAKAPDGKEKENEDVKTELEPKQKEIDPIEELATDIRRNVGIIEKAVAGKDLRVLARVFRSIGSIRKRITPDILAKTITSYIPDSYKGKQALVVALAGIPKKLDIGSAMDIDNVEKKSEQQPQKPDGETKKAPPSNFALLSVPAPSSIPEVTAYLHLLVVLMLIDTKRGDDAIVASEDLAVKSLPEFNRRTMDELSSRAYFYYARAIELFGQTSSIRSQLLAAYRTATLRHDAASQAVLLNLLLRNYITYNLYDQADKLLSRAEFPETRSNNQLARYLYYTGRIKAIQLDYSDALWNLQQALRKAPQNSALGFKVSAQKFMIIVQLLTGEVPARDIFRQSQMQRALRPYLHITQAVRNGDLQKFKMVLETSADEFESDRTISLIMRLRHNVIKTGLRMLSSSYSRISLSEICKRLHLDSPENAEGVVAKAIHDGVIDAVIDHKGGFVRSNETVDLYSTTEPTDAYHTRVQFCLNIYNEAIRAMRFPEKREDEETPEQRRERLKEQEELAKTLAEEEADDFEP